MKSFWVVLVLMPSLMCAALPPDENAGGQSVADSPREGIATPEEEQQRAGSSHYQKRLRERPAAKVSPRQRRQLASDAGRGNSAAKDSDGSLSRIQETRQHPNRPRVMHRDAKKPQDEKAPDSDTPTEEEQGE